MSTSRASLRVSLEQSLETFEAAEGPLPGIQAAGRRKSLIEQLVESERRNQYFARLLERDLAPSCCDPAAPSFDPLRAAVFQSRAGAKDEAFWMVFLFVHFGKNRRSGWRLISDVYGALGASPSWTWTRVSADVRGFRDWLASNLPAIRALTPRRGFGNHRKYESLEAWTPNGTGSVVASYVDWVGAGSSHEARLNQVFSPSVGNEMDDFDLLFRSVSAVRRFGRTGAFDYCATVGKLGLASVSPGLACLTGSTGPLQGSRLLICEPGVTLGPKDLEPVLAQLQHHLGIGFDALEDALCNWQKSPDAFKPFRG